MPDPGTHAATHPLVDDLDMDGGLSPDGFREVFRNHAAGVAVVTADPGDGPVALTATSVFSVSATPPLFVFSVSALSSATPGILGASTLVAHLLSADELELARLCSTSGVDRFGDPASWGRLVTGEPYFAAPRIRVRGVIVSRFEAGTSTLVVVKATHAVYPGFDAAAGPLVYHNRSWHELGSASAIR